MQLPLFTPKSRWSPPALSSLPSSWAEAKRIAIDVETRDDHLRELGIGVRRGGYVVGVSFAIEDGPKHYLPIRHAGGDNLDEAQTLAYLRSSIKSFTGSLVGANIAYDLDYLMEEGLDFSSVSKIRDIQIADPLIYELHQSYSLENIAQRWGLPGKDEEMLRQAAADYNVSPKSGLWKLPGRFVGEYGEGDVERPLQILRRQERRIDDEGLWDIYNLESDVTMALVRMRRRGIAVNLDKLERVEHWSLTQETEALERVRVATGYSVGVGNVWKAKAMAPALEAIGITPEETEAGAPSIDADFLSGIDHPVARNLAWARKVNKIRTTFAASVRKYLTNGRIHCNFNQIARESEKGNMVGGRYGRLSSDDPNMQQQPSREDDELKAAMGYEGSYTREWRAIYEPEPKGLWCANDYSQQEPRWTTHFAAVMDLPKARIAAAAYHADPMLDNHKFMAELTGLKRTFAKNIYLGLCYGEGGAKMCRQLGLPTRWALSSGRGREREIAYFETREQALEARRQKADGYMFEAAGEEGQEILDRFDDRAPFIRKLAKAAENKAKKVGKVITGGGRHLHFPQASDGSYDFCHKALNRIIQGTSADQTKRALVEIDRAGHFIQLQVHDEIDGTVADEAEGHRIGAIMRDVMPALVPFRVDSEFGSSWGASMG